MTYAETFTGTVLDASDPYQAQLLPDRYAPTAAPADVLNLTRCGGMDQEAETACGREADLLIFNTVSGEVGGCCAEHAQDLSGEWRTASPVAR